MHFYYLFTAQKGRKVQKEQWKIRKQTLSRETVKKINGNCFVVNVPTENRHANDLKALKLHRVSTNFFYKKPFSTLKLCQKSIKFEKKIVYETFIIYILF